MRPPVALLSLLLTIAPILTVAEVVESDLSTLPTLEFRGPEGLRSVMTRLENLDGRRLEGAMALVGLQEAGPPIPVIVAPESSRLAQRVPHWVVGYAVPREGVIVLLPERVPSYPYDSLEAVLVHEVMHLLMVRATLGHPIPRWFDEGLATMAARPWDLEDRARLVWTLASRRAISLDELNTWFHRDPATARQAYVLAAAFSRHLVREVGPDAPARILGHVGRGTSFHEAVRHVTARSMAELEAAFWKEQTLWNRWVPYLTSTAALWIAITILALYVFRKQRQLARAKQLEWERDESTDERMG